MSGTSTLNKIPLTMIEDIDKIGVGTKLLPDGDWNNALDNGIYTSTSYSENKNAPMSGRLIGHVMAYDDNYIFQELINYTSGNFERFERSKVGGVWGEWINADAKLSSHLAQMAQHNQFMDNGIKKQISFGVNSDLGCLTINIREVIDGVATD